MELRDRDRRGEIVGVRNGAFGILRLVVGLSGSVVIHSAPSAVVNEPTQFCAGTLALWHSRLDFGTGSAFLPDKGGGKQCLAPKVNK